MRALLIGLACFAVSACGFTPLYGSIDDETVGGALGQIKLGSITGPNEAIDYMRETLGSRLPRPNGDERYTVSVSLRERRQAVSVNIDSNTRRFNYSLVGTIVYVDAETKKRRVQNLSSEVSFGVVPSQYASLIGREDAVRRAVIDLARKIETDAALYAQGRAPQESEAGILQGTDQRDPLRNLEREAEAAQEAEAEAVEQEQP